MCASSGARNRIGRRRPVRGDDFFAQCSAFDVLGGDVELAIDFFQRVHRTDPRMREHGRRPRLATQTFALPRVGDQMRRECFQGDHPAEPRIRRQIHASHSAASQLADDGVGAYDRPRRQRLIVAEQLRHAIGDRIDKESAGARMMFEE